MPESNTIKNASLRETSSSTTKLRPESNSRTLKVESRKSEVPPKQRLPMPPERRSDQLCRSGFSTSP